MERLRPEVGDVAVTVRRRKPEEEGYGQISSIGSNVLADTVPQGHGVRRRLLSARDTIGVPGDVETHFPARDQLAVRCGQGCVALGNREPQRSKVVS